MLKVFYPMGETLEQTLDHFLETVPLLWSQVRVHIRAVATENFDITVEQFHILRYIRRGHGIILGRGGGMYNFVARIGTNMDQVYRISQNYYKQRSLNKAGKYIASVIIIKFSIIAKCESFGRTTRWLRIAWSLISDP